MSTIGLEGTGTTIAFGTDSVPMDVISITKPSKSRPALETTHLGSGAAKTFKPGKVRDPGTWEIEYDHDPAICDLISGPVQGITITYPLLPGQTTPKQIVINGFVTSEGGEEFKVEQLTRTKISIQQTGVEQNIAAT